MSKVDKVSALKDRISLFRQDKTCNGGCKSAAKCFFAGGCQNVLEGADDAWKNFMSLNQEKYDQLCDSIIAELTDCLTD